jgi:hypothetical protein
MWSASMLVTTDGMGSRFRNEASDSSASTTMYSPLPSRALAPALLRRPPMTKVGSRSAAASTLVTRLVVVVLPWVPAMATPFWRRISSASITARGTTGSSLAWAATTSGLSALTAVEVTRQSAPAMCAASCPMCTRAPRSARRWAAAPMDRSLPEMVKPWLSSTSAMPLMPAPPMPTKWM